METIDDLIALLESEADARHLWVVELLADGTILGEEVDPVQAIELTARHHGAEEAYRHALAQARHVKAHSTK